MTTRFTSHHFARLKACALKLKFFTLLFLTSLTLSFAQPGPVLEWQKNYAGNATDILKTWVEVSDGYLIGGTSNSGAGLNKTEATKGGEDFWIIKIDKNGNQQWDKTIGGSLFDDLQVIVPLSDGGFLLGGNSVSSISGDKTENNRGQTLYEDMWVIRITSNGTKVWDKTFGGSRADRISDIIVTSDGNYLLSGTSNSPISYDKSNERAEYDENGNLITTYDYWIVKITPQGTKLWDKSFSGRFSPYNTSTSVDFLNKSIETADGGFILAGSSNSGRGLDKSVGRYCYQCAGAYEDEYLYGAEDLWLIKVNSLGIKEWDKTYGGSFTEQLANIIPAPDGGYILGGKSFSSEGGNKTIFPTTPYDPLDSRNDHPWIFKISPTGEKIWENIFVADPSLNDVVGYMDIKPTTSGIYLINQNRKDSTSRKTYLSKFDWSGTLLNTQVIDSDLNRQLNAFNTTALGEPLVGYTLLNANNEDYFAVKYKNDTIPNTSAQFVQAVDLGAKNTFASMNVGGVSYVPYERSQNFTFTGKLYENQSLPVNPQADANTSKLLRSVVYGTSSSAATFNFTNLQTGPYNFYVYVWEDNVASTFSLKAEGKTVLTNYNTGGQGKWAKLGPFKSYVTDGALNIATSGGDANISGIELWKLPSEDFKVAYNFNGPATTIDNLNYQSSIGALNVQLIRGRSYANQTIALNPSTDSNRAAMIRSSYYSSATQPLELRIKGLENVAYNAYIYVWEDNSTSTYTLKLSSGTEVNQNSINSGTKGQWKKLGPYRITITGGVLDINVFNGDGNISGIELWKINDGSSPSSARLADLSFEEEKAIKAYPNPIQSELTVDLPSTVKGKVNITLSDAYGKPYYSEKKNVGEEGQVLLTLPSNKLKPGIYFLKIQSNTQEEVIRLTKE